MPGTGTRVYVYIMVCFASVCMYVKQNNDDKPIK